MLHIHQVKFNDTLKAFAKMVSDKICVNARNAGMYSILADETKGCSKKEQLSLVVRYVGC